MNDFLSFAILGLIEGVTEFLPVSSTGHLIAVRALLGLESSHSLAFDAVLQCGTILAVAVYFRRDLLKLLLTGYFYVIGRETQSTDRSLLIALIVGTIPAVFFGLLLENSMDTVFRNTDLVAYALLVGSAIFVLAEYVSTQKKEKLSLETIGWKKGILIGLFQSIALIPGMSRSGMTISGGLFFGLTREAAARFGFLLSVPIIFGSGIKKIFELSGTGVLQSYEIPLLFGTVVAFVSGLASIHVLLMFVRTQPLYIFALYRVLLAFALLFVLFP